MAYSTRRLRVERSRSTLIAEPDIGDGLPQSVVNEWRDQLLLYENYWLWMDGRVWDEIDRYAVKQQGQDPPLLFPLQINPIYTASIIHRNSLFGEVPDTGVPMVKPIAIPKRHPTGNNGTAKEKLKTDAKLVDAILERIWYQSNGRATMLDAGFVSQAIGGCVWKVSYEPWNQFLTKGIPIAFRQIEPEFFVPVYSMLDRYRLLEARIGRLIDVYEAKEVYNVDVSQRRDRALYLEVWDREKVKVTIDDKPAKIRKGDYLVDLSRKHGFGFVPFVYIPHETVGMFYGVPIVHQLGNLLKELNGRMADVGDAVRNSIERIILLTNADLGELNEEEREGGLRVLATGKEMAGSPGKSINVVDAADLPTGTKDYIEMLRDATWHAMFTPAVAYGEDEGSQRSALTLAFRMWPLTSHVRSERSLWTEALRLMSDMAIRILRAKQTGDYGDLAAGTPWRITDDHLDHMLMMDWAPMIPRDRESEINQLILRHQDEQLSTYTAMEKSGDIADLDDELERILEEKEDRLKLEAKYAVKASPGGGSANKKGAMTDTQQPIAAVETE